MTASTTTNVLLALPDLTWPYYWQLDVSNACIWVRLMKRPLGLWRTAIESKASEFVSHDGVLTQEVCDEIVWNAQQMVDMMTPADRIGRQLRELRLSKVKIKVDR